MVFHLEPVEACERILDLGSFCSKVTQLFFFSEMQQALLSLIKRRICSFLSAL